MGREVADVPARVPGVARASVGESAGEITLLTQLGVIVGFGVGLDSLLVRSVLVAAQLSLTGRRFWGPSPLSRKALPV